MKTKILVVLIVLLSVFEGVLAHPYMDKDKLSSVVRSQYLQQQFSFSQKQIERYDDALKAMAVEFDKLYNTPAAKVELEKQEKIIYGNFKSRVKQFLSTSQFVKWDKSNPTNEIRQYREYLGLDNNGIQKLQNIIASYKASVKSIYASHKIYTDIERIEIKANAYAKRNSDLSLLIGDTNVLEFNNHYDVYRQAKIMHKGWPSLSFNDIKKLAVLRLAFEKKRNAILCSNMSENQIKKNVNAVKKEYYNSVKESFSPEVYANFIKESDSRADFITKRNYKMSNAQLAKYKEVMNDRAVARFTVKKSNLSKAEKNQQNNEINIQTRTKLSKFLSPEQVDVWWRNLHKQR